MRRRSDFAPYTLRRRCFEPPSELASQAEMLPACRRRVPPDAAARVRDPMGGPAEAWRTWFRPCTHLRHLCGPRRHCTHTSTLSRQMRWRGGLDVASSGRVRSLQCGTALLADFVVALPSLRVARTLASWPMSPAPHSQGRDPPLVGGCHLLTGPASFTSPADAATSS
jgi:hypothetical protein